MQTVARLHNFCLTENNDYDEMVQMLGMVELQPSRQQDEIGLETNGHQPVNTLGVLYLECLVVQRVKDAGLSHN
jgi:hypothetical protein